MKEEKDRLSKQSAIVILSDEEDEVNNYRAQEIERLNAHIQTLKADLQKQKSRVAARSSVGEELERQVLLKDKCKLKNENKLLQSRINTLEGLIKRYRPANITRTVSSFMISYYHMKSFAFCDSFANTYEYIVGF